MELAELKETVTKKLMTDHDMLIDEAEETVKDSVDDNPSIWNENADAKDLANLLASDDDDE